MIPQRQKAAPAQKPLPHGDRQYQVWVRGSYSGKVEASDEQDARTHAARIFLVALDEVTVLPPF
jgi:hypothetical protein